MAPSMGASIPLMVSGPCPNFGPWILVGARFFEFSGEILVSSPSFERGLALDSSAVLDS